MPDVGMWVQVQAQVCAQAEAKARARAQASTSSVQLHLPEVVLPEDRWYSPLRNDVTQLDLGKLFPCLQLMVNRQSGVVLPLGWESETVRVDGWEWRYLVL